MQCRAVIIGGATLTCRSHSVVDHVSPLMSRRRSVGSRLCRATRLSPPRLKSTVSAESLNSGTPQSIAALHSAATARGRMDRWA